MQHLEYHEQCAVFEWAHYQSKKYPCLRFLHASTAGEKFKSAQQASRAKKVGMKAGVPDIFLPYPNGEYAGLFIEMKRKITRGLPKPTLSAEQKVWLDYLNESGYNAAVCYGAGEAIMQIQEYLQNNQKKKEHTMKITTFEMPINIARARARKWWLKATSIEFVYNAKKTKAKLIINANKTNRAFQQELLMSCLPLTKRGQKLSKLFKEWVAKQKVQKRTTSSSYVS